MFGEEKFRLELSTFSRNFNIDIMSLYNLDHNKLLVILKARKINLQHIQSFQVV